MSAGLLAVLINEIAVPELTIWLRSLHTSGTPLTDAMILQKLLTDTTVGSQLFDSWLASHPLMAPSVPASPGA
jgi:hypothetical protein